MIRRALASTLAAVSLAAGCSSHEVEPRTVTVAIVDTGIDPTATFVHAGEVDRALLADEDGHGTEMAWVVHRAAPQARILAVKADGPDGITDERLAAGIDEARRSGAHVVLVAMAGAEPLPRTRAAIARAGRDGVVVVAAAGNDGLDLDEHPAYPAAYDEPNLIAVAAVDRNGRLLGTSNRGSTVRAEGQGTGVATCTLDGTSARTGGTSAAAALVAGRAARVLEQRIPVDELRAALEADAALAASLACP